VPPSHARTRAPPESETSVSLFSRFFGGGDHPASDNPTGDWPAGDGPSPQISLERRALETFSTSVPFGAPLDALRALGRPEHYESPREGFCTLTYERWGIQCAFELGAMYQVSFLIGEFHRAQKYPGLVLAEPRGTDGRGLSSQTTKEELLHRFGEPGTVQDHADTVILYYNDGPLVSEYEVRDGRLSGWDLYVD
jgi:hypothetical protein